MAEDVKVSNFPDSGSPARVAYDLMRIVMSAEGQTEHSRTDKPTRKYLLDLYAECLSAAGGYPKGRQ